MRMQHEILDKIAALPGVTAAAFASAVPMEGRCAWRRSTIFVDGQTYAPGTTPPMRRMKTVSPGYFRAIGTRMIAGRDITWNDIYGRAKVAIISENFAREVVGITRGGAGAAHQRAAPAGAPVWREIIGVVEDVHEDALYQPAPAMVYWPVMMENFGGPPLFVMRADQSGHPQRTGGQREPAWRRPEAVWSVNPSMPVFLVRTMKDLYDESMARTSFALVMLGIAARDGAGARRHRHLRRDRLRRRAALARDRHPSGARRRAGRARCGCSCDRGWC